MNNFVLDPLASSWFVLLLVPLAAYFLWQEYQRKLRFRSLRMFAQTLILVALLGFYLRPGVYREQAMNKLVVLTSGYSSSAVDSLLQVEQKTSLVHLPGVEPFRGSRELVDSELERLASSIQWVVGDGFSRAQLDRLRNAQFHHLPSSIPVGIQSLNIPKEVRVGMPAFVSGTVNGTMSGVIRLLGPGGVEDSVQLAAGSPSFRLSFTSKKKGKLLYHLQLGDGVAEPVPVIVQEPRTLRILFIQAFPTAESRTLKNFLEESGHAIVARQQISRDDFLYTYSNTTPQRFTSINQKLLQNVDLLIIDEASLAKFSKVDQVTLLTAVENGLGVHVLPWEAFKNVSWLFPGAPEKIDRDTIHIKLKKNYVLPRGQYQWNDSDGFIPVWCERSKVISGYFLKGRGKVGAQVMTETFPIRFQGDTNDYALLWSHLLTHEARARVMDHIAIQEEYPFSEGDPLNLQLISQVNTPVVKQDSVRIGLSESAFIDQVWSSRIWAGKPGWHALSSESDTLFYFVKNQEQWKSLERVNQIRENKLKAIERTEGFTSSEYVQPISPAIFFVLMLLASGFLWLAPKL